MINSCTKSSTLSVTNFRIKYITFIMYCSKPNI